MEEKNKTHGYCTVTYKLKLYIENVDYLKQTKEIYNKVILFYYNLLLENLDYLNLSNQYCLRELEKLTVISKVGKIPKNYREDLDVPTYLRRAAINQAIGSVRSYISSLKNFKDFNNEETLSNSDNEERQRGLNQIQEPSRAIKFNSSPIFYKGMYKNLTQNQIEIKLWNGDKWEWYKAKIKGRDFNPEEALSPTIILNSKYAMIHIPVRKEIEDVTPIKIRMKQDNLKVLSLAFSNSDKLVTCVVLDKEGKFLKVKFIGGGGEYKSRTSKVLAKIKKDRKQTKGVLGERDHKNYWIKLNNLSTNEAHRVSREILDFAKKEGVTVISISTQKEGLDFITKKVGKYSPIYLRHKIISFLNYKAFKDGILITEVRSNYTASRCYKCRAKVTKNSKNCRCENGHEFNYYFNTAMNVGLMALKKFGNIK